MPTFTDLYTDINKNIQKYSTPAKGYGNEQRRRGWLQNWNEIGQGLQSANWNRGQSMQGLRRDVVGSGYDSGNVRGSWGKDTFNEGMTSIDHAYNQNLNEIQNAITGLQNDIWAYNNRPRGSARPKLPTDPTRPADPKAPGTPHAAVDPSTGKVIYPDEVYNGYDPGLVEREQRRASGETVAQTQARRNRQPYYDPTLGRMIYPV